MPIIQHRELSPFNNKSIGSHILFGRRSRIFSQNRYTGYFRAPIPSISGFLCTICASLVSGFLCTACAAIGFPALAVSPVSVSPHDALISRQSTYRQNIQFRDSFEVENAVGPAGRPLPLRVRLPLSGKEGFRFVMVRRLPENFKLSKGFGTRSYWVVSLDDVFGLSVTTPPDAQGAFELDVLLFRGEGTEPQRRKVKIVLQSDFVTASVPRQLKPQTGNETIMTSNPQSPPAAPVNSVDAQKDLLGKEMTLEDRSILLRGNKLFEEGNVTQARLFYQHLAKKGVSAGALAMAQTYDPKFLDELGVQGGVRPDPLEAGKWYGLASDLTLNPTGRQSAGP